MEPTPVSDLEKCLRKLEECLSHQIENLVKEQVRPIALAVLSLDQRCKTLEAFQPKAFQGDMGLSDTQFLQRRIEALERWREAKERAALESVRDSYKRLDDL